MTNGVSESLKVCRLRKSFVLVLALVLRPRFPAFDYEDEDDDEDDSVGSVLVVSNASPQLRLAAVRAVN